MEAMEAMGAIDRMIEAEGVSQVIGYLSGVVQFRAEQGQCDREPAVVLVEQLNELALGDEAIAMDGTY